MELLKLPRGLELRSDELNENIALIGIKQTEERRHPYGMPSFFCGLSHELKIARQLSIFVQPSAGPLFRVPVY